MNEITKDEIGGVSVSAPLFRGTPKDVLAQIVSHISSAGYHFADDSAKEWGKARGELAAAARLVNDHSLGAYAIKCLHRHEPQLVATDDFIDAILRDARERRD